MNSLISILILLLIKLQVIIQALILTNIKLQVIIQKLLIMNRLLIQLMIILHIYQQQFHLRHMFPTMTKK